MKYVRTKDGHILEIGKTNDYGFVYMPKCEYAVHFVDNESGYEQVAILEQADTIEELCDCWIIVLKYLNVKPYTENINCNIAHLINNEHQIYGAIWTYDSDGVPTLKTVAKMNEKGELELL